jgi:hypothetical protein
MISLPIQNYNHSLTSSGAMSSFAIISFIISIIFGPFSACILATSLLIAATHSSLMLDGGWLSTMDSIHSSSRKYLASTLPLFLSAKRENASCSNAVNEGGGTGGVLKEAGLARIRLALPHPPASCPHTSPVCPDESHTVQHTLSCRKEGLTLCSVSDDAKRTILLKRGGILMGAMLEGKGYTVNSPPFPCSHSSLR